MHLSIWYETLLCVELEHRYGEQRDNIALVIMGYDTGLIHRLTNDYQVIRKTLRKYFIFSFIQTAIRYISMMGQK